MMVIGMFLSGYLKETLSLVGIYVVSGVLIMIGASLLLPLLVEKRNKDVKDPAL